MSVSVTVSVFSLPFQGEIIYTPPAPILCPEGIFKGEGGVVCTLTPPPPGIFFPPPVLSEGYFGGWGVYQIRPPIDEVFSARFISSVVCLALLEGLQGMACAFSSYDLAGSAEDTPQPEEEDGRSPPPPAPPPGTFNAPLPSRLALQLWPMP